MTVSLFARAISLLSKREYSEHELRKKLAPYSTDDPALLEEVIQRLKEHHWQSDKRFINDYITNKSTRWGTRKILYELEKHQIDDETLSELKETLKETEFERAYEVWKKKFKDTLPETPQEWAKQARFLASRGFSQDVIIKILKP
ncbi:recombination regulator RecX [Basilea psittacipulmonis]|uniref:Regulatory protein RecX n=2 Tax=Basilea TaxID=1472344 RepID=A0A077DDR3_9BURK|nr:recombination regulator RecX [Basilea psittacipulmonis]AIL32739.1 hypothetical protein IX83_04945 [Basilea psittacipulmonis DSM 24701]